MYKLIILIEPLDDSFAFDETWPSFLHLAESMPGLRREVTVRVNNVIYGNTRVGMIHELFFDTQEELNGALVSPQGRAAGETLQRITGGRMTLLLGEHTEDDLENIRKYRSTDEQQNATSRPG